VVHHRAGPASPGRAGPVLDLKRVGLAAATLHAGPDELSEDPLADLVAELANFQRGVSRAGRLSLVGTILQDNTAPEVLARYRAQLVGPRRGRIRTILNRAQRSA